MDEGQVVYHDQLDVYGVVRKVWRNGKFQKKIMKFNPETFQCDWNKVYDTSPDWRSIKRNSDFQKAVDLLDYIYDADWYYGVKGQSISDPYVEEALIENPKEVYHKIKNIFIWRK